MPSYLAFANDGLPAIPVSFLEILCPAAEMGLNHRIGQDKGHS